MTTPEQLEELKAKYPLAFDTIKLPVRYSSKGECIYDAYGGAILDIRRTTDNERLPDPAQDQIGELIAELLNQLK